MRSFRPLAVGMLMLAAVTLATAQTPAPATAPTSAGLTIDLEGGATVSVSADEFAKLPHEDVAATDHDGSHAIYSGVPLSTLLALVKAPAADKLRGPAMALYVVAEGADGYKATFSLVEADDGFGERHILIADARDAKPLPAKSAPLQLIVPQDKRQGRWVRTLAALHVRRAA